MAHASTTSTTGAAIMRATSSVLPGNSWGADPADSGAMPWPSSTPMAPSTIARSAPSDPSANERRTPSRPSSQESRLRHGLRLACARYAVSMKSAPTLKVWTVRPRALSAAVRPRLIEVFPEPEPRPPTTSRGIPTSSSMRCLRICAGRLALSPAGSATLAGLAHPTLAPAVGRGKCRSCNGAWARSGGGVGSRRPNGPACMATHGINPAARRARSTAGRIGQAARWSSTTPQACISA